VVQAIARKKVIFKMANKTIGVKKSV